MSSEKRLPAKVLPHALVMPATNKLHGKRFILASASPRRKEILETFVRGTLPQAWHLAHDSALNIGIEARNSAV